MLSFGMFFDGEFGLLIPLEGKKGVLLISRIEMTPEHNIP